MINFKIGDEVECIISHGTDLIIGNKYIITELNTLRNCRFCFSNHEHLKVKENQYFRSSCRFKLTNSLSSGNTPAGSNQSLNTNNLAEVQKKENIWCSCEVCEKRTYCSNCNNVWLCKSCKQGVRVGNDSK
jgi:hypothetical protein